MESQPQNPEFRINTENFHPCTTIVFTVSHNLQWSLLGKFKRKIRLDRRQIVDSIRQRLLTSHLLQQKQHITRPLVKSAYQKYNFLVSQPNHMFWVLK